MLLHLFLFLLSVILIGIGQVNADGLIKEERGNITIEAILDKQIDFDDKKITENEQLKNITINFTNDKKVCPQNNCIYEFRDIKLENDDNNYNNSIEKLLSGILKIEDNLFSKGDLTYFKYYKIDGKFKFTNSKENLKTGEKIFIYKGPLTLTLYPIDNFLDYEYYDYETVDNISQTNSSQIQNPNINTTIIYDTKIQKESLIYDCIVYVNTSDNKFQLFGKLPDVSKYIYDKPQHEYDPYLEDDYYDELAREDMIQEDAMADEAMDCIKLPNSEYQYCP